MASGSVIAGRFTIERVIGIGGMGTVYVARDGSLGRDVAIKLHHAAGGGVRLRREAIAMARLAHPNVVTVFEVGELEQRPFVVMELVIGTTLRDWLRAAPRTVREILETVVAAGEGLAAAHDAGLVHRDIKPENVLIGGDGRARVGDFGLARELDSKEDPSPAASTESGTLTSVTQTGAVLGTPAYMSPEQLAGGMVDARADQFAFCIMVWEALWKERPFAGATLAQLTDAVAKGTLRTPPPRPKVSARVRAALERGLAKDPDARFPSLHALLAELREPQGRRRRVAIALVGVGVALGVAGYLAFARASAVSCGEPEDPVLPRDLPGKLRAVGATDPAERVQLVIDRLSTQYRSAKRFGCEALNVRHAWSPELAAKSDACLAVEMRVAQRMMSSATVGRANAFELVRRAAGVHPLDPCTDPAYLAATPQLPTDPTELDAMVAARAEIRLAFSELQAAPRATIESAIAALASSPVHGDAEVAAGILVIRGHLLSLDGKLGESNKMLADAYYAARTVDDPTSTLAALGALIDNATRLSVDRTAADQWLRTALADSARLRKRSPWFTVRVELIAARLADDEENAEEALAHVATAQPLIREDDPDGIDLLLVKADVEMWSGKVEQGVADYDKALAASARRYGADAPGLGSPLASYASSLLAAGQADKAIEVATRAVHIIASSPDPGSDALDSARVNLAAVLIGVDRDDEAQPLLEQARRDDVAMFGETNQIVANIDSNLAVIAGDRGDHAGALALLEKVLAIDLVQSGPDSLEVASRRYNIAVSLGKLERHAEALASAQKSLAIFAAKNSATFVVQRGKTMVAQESGAAGDPATAIALTTEVLAALGTADDPQSFAWAHLVRARAHLSVHHTSEAKADLAAAHAGYLAAKMAERVTEVEGLQQQLR